MKAPRILLVEDEENLPPEIEFLCREIIEGRGMLVKLASRKKYPAWSWKRRLPAHPHLPVKYISTLTFITWIRPVYETGRIVWKKIIGQSNVLVSGKRHFIIGSASQLPAAFLFIDTAPLFKEKGNALFGALLADIPYPPFLHGPCFTAALTASDDPVNIFQVHVQ